MEVSLTGRRWSYDRAMHDLEKIVRTAGKRAGDARKNLEREQRRIDDIKRKYDYECAISSWKRLSPEAEAAQVAIWHGNLTRGASAVQSATNIHRAMQRQHEFLAGSKVFIIGPATTDSLLYWEPRDGENESESPCYDFIRDGRLPFPAMFFEFFDPVRFSLPFDRGGREVLGMNLVDTQQVPARIKDDQTGLRYVLSLFYQRDKGVEPGLVVAMNPDKQEVFIGSSEKTRFRIDMRERTVEFDESYDGMRNHYPRKRVLGSDDEAKPFVTIANLATNLVNYINAHNVYVRAAGQRRVHPSDEGVSPPPSRFQPKRPFYVVEIRDEVVDREEQAERAYTLSCQFWVRGHNRRYRNPAGTIRYTTWIKWHKKGPEGAPWKEHRWAVSNDKILREMAMLKELKRE